MMLPPRSPIKRTRTTNAPPALDLDRNWRSPLHRPSELTINAVARGQAGNTIEEDRLSVVSDESTQSVWDIEYDAYEVT